MTSVRRVPLLAMSVVIVLGCSCFSRKAATGDPEHKNNGAMTSNNKLDAALVLEMQKQTSGPQADRAIDVTIRTKTKANASELAEIEKRGGLVGSVIGDVVTARVPARSIESVAALEFVVSLEKAKKQRAR